MSAQSLPDLTQAREEMLQHLQALVRIDTSNPPGNETKVAEYLKGVLAKEGIASEILALDPARGNLVARIKGNGTKKPLLLMAHEDVVGVERDQWSVDPFAAAIKDGYLYGRGSYDDKSMMAVNLQIVLMLKRRNAPLDRDIIFLAEAGEEGTAAFGINFLVEKHLPKIEAEYALNEGGPIYVRDGKVQYLGVSTTEKVPNRLRLVAKGKSGHASVPRPDSAIVHLAGAVAKIGERQAPFRLNETTRVFFRKLAAISKPEEAYLFEHLEDPVISKRVDEALRLSDNRMMLTYNSMLRTSASPTIIKGGFRSNVIPSEAEVMLDVRALPDEEMPAFIEELRKLIDDPSIEIVRDGPTPAAPPVSRPDSEMYRALEKAGESVFPGAPTLPFLWTGATDSALLRAKGVQAYGIRPPATDEDLEGMHGNNERVSIDGLGKFLEYLYRTVTDIAVAR